jgi:uncharacterized protein YecT (DUF1311 family)
MRIAVLILALTIAAPSAAKTDVEKRYTKAYDICMSSGDAARGVQPAMNDCASEEYARQDSRLNKVYVAKMGRQSAAGKTKLRGLQRGWIKTRDQKCIAEEKEYEGGSIAPLIFLTCKTNETIMRVMWLERYR